MRKIHFFLSVLEENSIFLSLLEENSLFLSFFRFFRVPEVPLPLEQRSSRIRKRKIRIQRDFFFGFKPLWDKRKNGRSFLFWDGDNRALRDSKIQIIADFLWGFEGLGEFSRLNRAGF